MTRDEWIKLGQDRGWCGDPFCYTHDQVPLTEPELDAWGEDDTCVLVVRLHPEPGNA